MFSALNEKVERLEKENEDLKARLAAIENTPKVKRRAHICRFEDGSKIYNMISIGSNRFDLHQLSIMVDIDKKGPIIIDIESFLYFPDVPNFDLSGCSLGPLIKHEPVHFYYQGKYLSDVPQFIMYVKNNAETSARVSMNFSVPKGDDVDKLKLLLQAFGDVHVDLLYCGQIIYI